MISLSTHRLRAVAAFALIFAGLASAASAQTTYPNRTITLVLPFAAGSGTDTTPRTSRSWSLMATPARAS